MHTQNIQKLLFSQSLHIQSMMWNTKERDNNNKNTKTVVFTQPSHSVHDVKHQGEGQQQQKYKKLLFTYF